jgi:hypothetical protein
LARCRHHLGQLLADLGQWPDADQSYRPALEIKEKLAADFPITALGYVNTCW